MTGIYHDLVPCSPLRSLFFPKTSMKKTNPTIVQANRIEKELMKGGKIAWSVSLLLLTKMERDKMRKKPAKTGKSAYR